ncbi:Ppx/GppA family phosphatase OS=Streptomyces alboniger OX=132473 GN=CP975_19920 PE=3 SV=1 [Streptomyces alboniger]
MSLPLGAGRLTAGWIPTDPPDPEAIRALQRHVRAQIAPSGRRVHPLRHSRPRGRHVQDLKQLARLAGAARSAEGLYVQRDSAAPVVQGASDQAA